MVMAVKWIAQFCQFPYQDHLVTTAIRQMQKSKWLKFNPIETLKAWRHFWGAPEPNPQ
jgi:hypothetical protein